MKLIKVIIFIKNKAMTQEDKELLLKDICARLPYGIKVRYSSYKEFITCTLLSINPIYNNVDLWSKNACFNPVSISKIKPYLFPLSSMTEEQKKESPFESSLLNAFINGYISLFEDEELTVDDIVGMLNWFNKNHFDYRGLIEKGLAIDATGLNIY